MRKLVFTAAILVSFWVPLLAGPGARSAEPGDPAYSQAAKPVQNASLKSRLAIEAGNKLREKQDFPAALRAYQNAIRLQPENSNAWFYLGIAYVNMDRFDEARVSFKKSVLHAPDDPAKWMGLCLSNYLIGDFHSVITSCKETVRLDPQQADGWAWLGLGYAHADQLEKSLRCLEIAASLNTNSTEAWYTLGMRYARLGVRSKVLDVYRHLQDLDPAQARKFLNLVVSPKFRG